MIPESIGIIGLGLIGGTLAKTIRRIYPQLHILACDTDEETLHRAAAEQIISEGISAPGVALRDCRYIFLCAPVMENESFLQETAPWLSENCLLTDTGSVKSSIHEYIKKMGLSRRFLGGHPMAGSEKSGYINSTAYLFENAYYLITGDEEVPKQAVEEYREFILSLGMLPLITTPEKHDYMTAAVSHLPHILASSLVNLVNMLDDEQESMKAIAAGGFKDITRIASSSPVMWQEICLSNREQILRLLDAFIVSLEHTKEEIAVSAEDKLLSFFQQAKDYRDSLPMGRTGPIPAIFEVYCDLIDEAGGIAALATILASNNISIKNIGIIHNREFEEGVLRIEFYEDAALRQALILLKKYHYTIHER